MRDAFIQRLTLLAQNDPRVMLITGDLGFGVLTDFANRFPAQYLNVGIAEQNMAGVATGLALEGFKVYIYSIGNFVFMRNLEQIRNDASYHDCNVNVISVGAGFSYGALGISHHATEDLSIMRAIPGVKVVSPGDDWEAQEATEAIGNTPGVCYMRLDRVGAQIPRPADEVFELGRARTVAEGEDLTLVASGGILAEALEARKLLYSQGISCRVVSMHTVKPLDTESLDQAVRETGGIVTIEEHTVDGGLGGAIAEYLLESDYRPSIFQRIGLRAGFSSTVGSQTHLRQIYGLSAAGITNQILQRLSQVRRRRAA